MSKISIKCVKPGMVLESPIYTETNNKLLLPAGAVLSERNIAYLEKIDFTFLDIADRYTTFATPFQKMKEYLKKMYGHYISIYASEKEEENLCDEMAFAAKVTRKIVEDVCERENIVNICMQMYIQDSDLFFEHAVLTSVLSGLLAGSLSLPEEEIENIILAGLLHNIGVLEMAYLIPRKDELTGQEELLWKEHPSYGYYFAIQEGISREAANIIVMHHERWDGTGYPNHLKGNEIPIEAQVVSICGSISDFIIFRKQQPYEAVEYLYGTSNMHFDKKIVDAFSNNVALYPLGTLVRLTTGEVGVVSNIRKNRGTRPIINVYYNRFKKPYLTPKVVDLAKQRTVFISQILAF